jgi:hypothetical protein
LPRSMKSSLMVLTSQRCRSALTDPSWVRTGFDGRRTAARVIRLKTEAGRAARGAAVRRI